MHGVPPAALRAPSSQPLWRTAPVSFAYRVASLLMTSVNDQLLLRWVDVDARRHQDAVPIALVTRILEELVIGPATDHRVKRNRERTGERLRILDPRFVMNEVLVDRRIPFDDVKLRAVNNPMAARRRFHRLVFANAAVAEDPRVVVEIRHIDDQRIALPVSARIAHRQPDAGVEMRTAVQR